MTEHFYRITCDGCGVRIEDRATLDQLIAHAKSKNWWIQANEHWCPSCKTAAEMAQVAEVNR